MGEDEVDGDIQMADGQPLLEISNQQNNNPNGPEDDDSIQGAHAIIPPLLSSPSSTVGFVPTASGLSESLQRQHLSPRINHMSLNRLHSSEDNNHHYNHLLLCGQQSLSSPFNTNNQHLMSGGSSSSPIDDSYLYCQEDISGQSFPSFQNFRIHSKLLDVVISVDGKRIPGHRVFLAATIPFFHAMFTNDMRESNQAEITITAENIDGRAFESLIDFSYTGLIRITSSNVQQILVAASYLGLQKVCDACSEFLKIRLQPNNVLGIKSFAESLSCPNLVTAAKKFIEKHFETVSKSDEFLQLTVDEVVDIISKDDLNVRGEETVFEGVIQWVKYDVSKRESEMPKLLTQVRLPLLTPQYLTDFVATESLIRGSHACRDLLDEAKDYHLMPERRPLLQSFRTRVRCCSDSAGVIYAVGGLTKSGDSLSTVETYDPLTGKWTMAEAMSMLRSRVGVAVMGSKLYAIGGYNGSERLSTVEVFDPETKKWAKVAPMNCKRSAVGAATLHNRLYVCGG